MDSLEILHYLKFFVGSDYHFEVIPASDLAIIDFKKDKDTVLVVHVPIKHESYGHFIVFEVSCAKPVAKYFDSFGLDVYNYLDHIPFQIVNENKTALQDPKSCTCGLYALFYIIHRVKYHFTFNEILSFFGTDAKANDRKVSKFFDRLSSQMPNYGRMVQYKLLKCAFMYRMLDHLQNDLQHKNL